MCTWALVLALLADAAAPTAARQAAELLGEAIREQRDGNHTAALETLARALELHRHAKILYYQALSLQAVGDYSEARRVLLAIKDHNALADRRTTIDAILKDLEDLLLPVLVRLDTDPAGASVELDGRSLGIAPVEARIVPGRHHLRVTRSGYRELERTIVIAPGKTYNERFGLESEAIAAPATPAPEEVPPPAPEPPVTQVTAKAESLEQPGVWPWLIIGTGAAGVATGLGFVGKHFYDASRLKPATETRAADRQSNVNLAIGVPTLGIGIATLFVGWWWLPASPDDVTAVVVGERSVMFVGRF